jgi:hypothetical protein
MNREDHFSGTWKLNPEKSRFDPNHRPMSATMCWERTAEGYSMKAEGINSEGQAFQERPQRLIVDGHEHPVPDAPGDGGFLPLKLQHHSGTGKKRWSRCREC